MLIEFLLVLLAGLCFGSFVTMASYRLVRGEDIVFKPSYCPECQSRLRFLDLWPLASWLAGRGCCRYCKAHIPARYPLTEIATAAGFAALYLYSGVTELSVVLALLWVMLMVMIVADFEHYIIPDAVHIVLVPLGLHYHFVADTPPDTVVYGFLAGAGIGLSLHYGYGWLRGKEVLGFGDVKFFAVAGLWLGVASLPPFLFYSGLLGIVIGLLWRAWGKGPVFPFGPAMALALFIGIAFPEANKLFWSIGYLL